MLLLLRAKKTAMTRPTKLEADTIAIAIPLPALRSDSLGISELNRLGSNGENGGPAGMTSTGNVVTGVEELLNSVAVLEVEEICDVVVEGITDVVRMGGVLLDVGSGLVVIVKVLVVTVNVIGAIRVVDEEEIELLVKVEF